VTNIFRDDEHLRPAGAGPGRRRPALERGPGEPCRRRRRERGRADRAADVCAGVLVGCAGVLVAAAVAAAAFCLADVLCRRLASAGRRLGTPECHDVAWVLVWSAAVASTTFVVVQWWRGRHGEGGVSRA
jgi:hypothetical protein